MSVSYPASLCPTKNLHFSGPSDFSLSSRHYCTEMRCIDVSCMDVNVLVSLLACILWLIKSLRTSAIACSYVRVTCGQNIPRLSSERTMVSSLTPYQWPQQLEAIKDGRQSGEEKRSLRQALQGGVARTLDSRTVSVWVRNTGIVKPIELIICNRSISMMLTNASMRADMIALPPPPSRANEPSRVLCTQLCMSGGSDLQRRISHAS